MEKYIFGCENSNGFEAKSLKNFGVLEYTYKRRECVESQGKHIFSKKSYLCLLQGGIAMKKILAMVLSLAMVSSLSVPVFAADRNVTAPKLGEVNVKITKVWDDEGCKDKRPESITVNVGEKEVVLSEEDQWKGSVVVDAFGANGTLKTYAVSEDAVPNYTTEINPKILEMQGFAELEQLERDAPCNTTDKPFDGYNLGVFKKGGNYTIWTAQELTEGAKIALKNCVQSQNITDLANLGDVVFVYGFENPFILQSGKPEVTIHENGSVTFDAKDAWSWFYRGNVAMAQDTYGVTVTNTYVPPVVEPEYEWVQTGSDSATGYDPHHKVEGGKKSWFMYNEVEVSNWEVGDSEEFDIQAGNYKNGTNFVGTYTVTKTEKGFVISYELNDEYYDDDTKELRIGGMNLWYNGNGAFVNSPGNQKGKATAVDADEVFAFEGETLFVFAHFNVSYWECVPVVEVVE